MKKLLLLAFLVIPLFANAQAYILPADTAVCYGNNTGALRLKSATYPVKRWEMSITGQAPWVSINVLTNNLDFNNLVNTAWYRVILLNGSSEIAVNPVRVVVDPEATGGSITGATLVCSGSNSGILTVTGYQGTIVDWEYGDGINWNSKGLGSLANELQYNNISNKTFYRAVVRSGSTCSPVTSPAFAIDVNAQTNPGTIAGAATLCEGTNTGNIQITSYTGSILRWESSSSGSSPWTPVSNTTNNLSYQDLLQTTYYRAIVKSGVCPEATSASAKIQIDKTSSGGITGMDAAVCAKTNDGYITVTAYKGTINNWQYSENGGVTWKDTAVNSNTIQYSGLNSTRLYRTAVTNGICPVSYSSNTKITVNPLPKVVFAASNKPQGETITFSNTSSIASGTIAKYYWDFNDGQFSVSRTPQHAFDNYGTYRAKLEATSDKGCLDSTFQNIEIYNVPKVDFAFSNICLKDDAAFLNTTISTETSLNYSWSFGDGSPLSSDKDPIHHYAAPGQYSVKLTVSSPNATSSATKTIEIYRQATPAFSTQNVCIGNNMEFVNKSNVNNGYLTYNWAFGDGTISQELNPAHKYANPGAYVTRLITTTNHSCLDTLYKTVYVNPKPKANFGATNVPFGFPVVFSDSSVFTGNLNYSWDFGDGNSASTPNPQHSYVSSGNFPVKLEVRSDSGCMHNIIKNVWVYPKPHADFTFKPVCIYDSVTFENLSTISSGKLTYKWAMGNEGSSALKNPKWKFETPGSYQIQLITVSEFNGTDTIVKTIEIYPQPEASFSANNVCDGEIVAFTNNSTVSKGTLSSFLWDFGDGSNAVRQTPTRLYLNPGDYTVKLTVTSNYNCQASTSKPVTVYKNPTANFTVSNVCFGVAVTPVNISDADINSDFAWDMGEAAAYNVYAPRHYYTQAGTWPVKLKVTTGVGCVDSLVRNVIVYALPSVNAGKDTTAELGFPIQLNGQGGMVFNWYPADGLNNAYIRNPMASPTSTTKYYLTVEDEYGCINRDSVTLSIIDSYKIIVSNVVTPDGNGQNDTWHIGNIENYPDAEIVIFDRWGKIVLKTTNYQNDWQGRNSKNDILPDGTYYYVITIPGTDMIYKGSINILRNK
jgi:gliding motility-associated-like protein